MSDTDQQFEHAGSTSLSLLQRALAQDASAWSQLSKIYGPLVYQWCRRFGLQPTDAEDVVQDVFIAVARGLASFHHDRPSDSFRAWLRRITRNKVYDSGRKRGRETEGVGGSSAHQQLQQLPHEDPGNTDEATLQNEGIEVAGRALTLMQQDFAENTWKAFWYTAVECETAEQAGCELGIKVGNVYVYKSRVLRRLREEFDGLGLMD